MFIGSRAGEKGTNGNNCLIGSFAGYAAGGNVVAIGTAAGQNSTGNDNVFIGGSAGQNNTGTKNTFIGRQTGQNSGTDDKSVYIGYQTGSAGIGSNRLAIDNSNTSTPLIYGEFDNDAITINGSHEITKAVRTSAIETVTAASDTLDDTNHVVLCDCTSNAITINLPDASGNTGLTYIIKKVDSTSNTVTINGNASETIDGATTQVIGFQYDSVRIVCDGTSWNII